MQNIETTQKLQVKQHQFLEPLVICDSSSDKSATQRTDDLSFGKLQRCCSISWFQSLDTTQKNPFRFLSLTHHLF